MLANVTVEQGAAAASVAAAAAFAGEGLRFAVTGAGATINPATGVVTLITHAARVETVTVIATNSGGSAEAGFLLTVKTAKPVWVPPLAVKAPTLAGPAVIAARSPSTPASGAACRCRCWRCSGCATAPRSAARPRRSTCPARPMPAAPSPAG